MEVEDEPRSIPIPDWQRRTLDERLADIEQNPDDEQTWEDVKAELWPYPCESPATFSSASSP